MKSIIDNKILNRERLTSEDALYLYREASLEDLSRWATTVKSRYHAVDEATYLIMRIINYTNVCVALCDYCAFYELPHSSKGYVLTLQQIFDKFDEILDLGGDFVGFNGGFNPDLKIDWYENIFTKIRERYRDRVEFYGMTVAELMYVAKRSGLSYFEASHRLKQAGVHWITGGGSEILTNEFRKRHSPNKYTADEFFVAQGEILRAGIRSTATMVIGFDESHEERVEHLQRTRDFQDLHNGQLFSFLTWTYKPYNTQLGGTEVRHDEYLRHLAVCRIFLDNFRHIRASVLTQNENALRGLHFGANDFDIPLEDEVTQLAGATINRSVSDVLAAAQGHGFKTRFRPMAKAADAATLRTGMS